MCHIKIDLFCVGKRLLRAIIYLQVLGDCNKSVVPNFCLDINYSKEVNSLNTGRSENTCRLSHNLRDLTENISWIRIGLTVNYPFLCPRRQCHKKISNCKYCAIMKLLPNDIYEMRYFAINKNCDGNSFYHFIVPYFLIGIRHFDNP